MLRENFMMECPLVSLIIVALNEEKALPKLLMNLKSQSYPHNKLDIILVDSMSNDSTQTIMNDFKNNSDFYRVVCKKNEKVLQAAGWNVGLDSIVGEIIIRLDAHASIPDDFIEKNVRCIESGHDICGGQVLNYIANETNWTTVINMAEASMFGGSVAAFRRKHQEGEVRTLAFASYKREVFDRVGRFDERLARTEDNEMHYRMRCAGYVFFYNPDIVSFRETRPTLKKLIRQKYLNGYWVGITSKVCVRCLSLYHFIPLLFVLAIIATTVLNAFGIWQLGALLWGLYIIVAIAMSIVAIVNNEKKFAIMVVLPFIFLLLHVAYGSGTIIGILVSFLQRRDS